MRGINGKCIKKIKVDYDHLIICEGQDEYSFLVWYLNSQERAGEDSRFASSVQVIDYGGNEELTAFLKILRNSDGFVKAKTILIVRDFFAFSYFK